MGAYINPHNCSKEQWLTQFATATDGPCEITETQVPVCWVNNGPFSAAAIGFDQGEISALQREDGRPKRWFKVSRTLAREVSDLASYERSTT